MRRIAIIGAGGSGRGVSDIIQQLNLIKPIWQLVGFLDDDATRDPIGMLDGISKVDVDAYVISLADPRLRQRVDTETTDAAALVHPAAVISSFSAPAPGLIVRGNATIAGNVSFGRHAHINMNATVGHDVEVGDYVTIHPGANIGGGARLLTGSTVGAGAVLLPGITVGHHGYVGAGAVVTRDVAPETVVTGNPARHHERQLAREDHG